MRTTQMALMANECREHTTGFNQVRMICAKTDGHVAEGDIYHHDPFHNVTWREITVENTPAEVASRVVAQRPIDHVVIGLDPSGPTMDIQPRAARPPVPETFLAPLRSGVVYVRPLKRPTLAHWLKAAVWA